MKPFFDIQAQYQEHKEEFDVAIQEVLDSGKFIMGPQVKELETELERYTGAKHCISCANGTDALQIALMAIEIKPGDEVITTPFTFAATAEAIILLGGIPVYVDIEEDSFLINATLIEEKITKKTKAIIPVSLYGQIADMDAINVIADKASQEHGHKIFVIEDGAQSFGAEYKGKKSCNVSDIATTSFFPTKPLGCFGDGGALFTKNDSIAKTIRQIRVHGQRGRYQHEILGVNSRLDTIQAAVLLVRLKYIDLTISKRQRIAKQYEEKYRGTDIIPPYLANDRTHVYGQYTVRVPEREKFVSELEQQGIPSAIHYPVPLNLQLAFKNTSSFCPVAEALSSEVVSLPMCLVSDICL